MRLARKLTLALALGIFAVMAGYAVFELRQEVVLWETDVQPMAPRGRGALAILRAIWARDGEESARELVEASMDMLEDVDVGWRHLDVPPGDPGYVDLDAAERQQLQRGEVVQVVRTDVADPRRFVFLPVQPGGPAVLEASQSLRRQMTFVRTSHRAMVVATLVITAVCGLIALALGARFVGRPTQALRDQARRMGDGDFTHHHGIRQRDEIGELAEEMNVLCDRLAEAQARITAEQDARIAALEQLRHSDRLATVGQLASGVAHELGTPLSIVSARATLMASGDLALPDVVQNARVIAEESGRMAGIIRQLLDFSRRRGTRLGLADVRRLIEHTLDLLSSAARTHHVTLVFTPPASPVLAHVDRTQLEQALTNVVLNGVQAMPQGGRLTVDVDTCHTAPPPEHRGQEGEWVRITVEDEGEGIPREHLGRLFEPFFTTKEVGLGTGLGLSVAHGIVAEHGGWIQVESDVGKGTRFRMFLPFSGAETAQHTEVAS